MVERQRPKKNGEQRKPDEETDGWGDDDEYFLPELSPQDKNLAKIWLGIIAVLSIAFLLFGRTRTLEVTCVRFGQAVPCDETPYIPQEYGMPYSANFTLPNWSIGGVP